MIEPAINAKELRLVKYLENSDYDANLLKKQSIKHESKVSLGLKIDTDSKLISVTIDLEVSEVSLDSELSQFAFSAKTSQDFIIENMSEAFVANENGEIIFSSEFCNQLGAITIAESRGIIASIPKRKEFFTMNIPIFEWKNILINDIIAKD